MFQFSNWVLLCRSRILSSIAEHSVACSLSSSLVLPLDPTTNHPRFRFAPSDSFEEILRDIYPELLLLCHSSYQSPSVFQLREAFFVPQTSPLGLRSPRIKNLHRLASDNLTTIVYLQTPLLIYLRRPPRLISAPWQHSLHLPLLQPSTRNVRAHTQHSATAQDDLDVAVDQAQSSISST